MRSIKLGYILSTTLLSGVLLSACGAESGDGTVAANGSAEGSSLESAHFKSGTTPAQKKLFAPPPQKGAVEQYVKLLFGGQKDTAAKLWDMATTPQAIWLEDGTPAELTKQVRLAMFGAALTKTVPVFVTYNIPFRDCAQFSAGGATSTEEYLSWIDGIAKGIGNGEAIVLLEPDSLGIIPFYTSINNDSEWCKPSDANPETAAAERFEQLNGAVDRLTAGGNVKLYLDATHSGWLGAGDIAHRLDKAGVKRSTGFFLNLSNYRTTATQAQYGTWISKCLAFEENVSWGATHFDWCPSQYYPASPNDVSTWHLTDEAYAGMLGDIQPTVSFVIDTSRNGQGPWTPPEDHPAGDPQDWCNPPGRGLGDTPTLNTGVPLVDAYLWVKTPGESDGACNRWNEAGGIDPVRNMMDPGAGEWFPEQALELIANANPAL